MHFRTRFWIILIALVAATPASAGNLFHGFSQVYGDLSNQEAWDVAVDQYGNVVITGHYIGTIDFGVGPMVAVGEDIFLAKFDKDGNCLWSSSFGNGNTLYSESVAVDHLGNIYITGYIAGGIDFGGGVIAGGGTSDIFVAKFDPDGNHLWSNAYGDSGSQYGQAIEVYPDGSVAVGGGFSSQVNFGGSTLVAAGSVDVFVVKLTHTGSHLWSKRFGDLNSEEALGLAVDQSGNLTVTGFFSGTIDFGGGGLSAVGGFDAFLAQFDASGNYNWSQRFGDAFNDYGSALAADDAGNIVLTGYFYGGIDFGGGTLTSSGSSDLFLAKLTSGGTHIWSQRFGDAGIEKGGDVGVDPLDNVIMIGTYQQQIDFGGGSHVSNGQYDICVARFASDGAYAWSEHYGAVDDDRGVGVKTDEYGNVWTTGYTRGTVDFGGGPRSGGGSEDVYLMRHHLGPDIVAVRDVPFDQGGLVNVSWEASGVDNVVDAMITEYTVWRAIDPTLAATMIAGGSALVKDASGTRAVAAGQPVIRAAQADGAPFYWFLVTTVDAFYLPGYSAAVPTLFDSTATGNENHYFQVIAHTSTPTVFYTSNPDTGYSVDNLAPAMPLNLAGQQKASPYGLELRWDANTEPDLSHYTVYRGTDAGFTPGPGNRIASPTDPTTFDGNWQWGAGYYYKVGAVDIHDNESLFAVLGPELVTGTGGTPTAVYLSQNFPNPFNPTTTIAFAVDRETDVSLRIYDVSGRLVRTLVDGTRAAQRHEVTWGGRDDAGRRVTSGVYFYRLTAGEFEQIRKMVLLK